MPDETVALKAARVEVVGASVNPLLGVFQRRIERELALYRAGGATVHLWRAFSVARRAGEPLPVEVTDYLGRVAERICAGCASPREVAEAVELGKPQQRRADDPDQTAESIFAEVRLWQAGGRRRTRVRAFEAVAKQRSVAVWKIREAYYAFEKILEKSRM